MSSSEQDLGWKKSGGTSMIEEDLAALGHVDTPAKPERVSSIEKTILAGSRKAVIPPAILAVRMQRYSVYLMVLAFALLAVNYRELRLSSVLWYASVLCAVFAIMSAVAVVILNAVAWNFDRLRTELQKDTAPRA